MAIWCILRTFGTFYDHLVHFVFIWYIFSGFGIMYQEKSDNPDFPSHQRFFLSSFWQKESLFCQIVGVDTRQMTLFKN
jgi:hypothetical protein